MQFGHYFHWLLKAYICTPYFKEFEAYCGFQRIIKKKKWMLTIGLVKNVCVFSKVMKKGGFPFSL